MFLQQITSSNNSKFSKFRVWEIHKLKNLRILIDPKYRNAFEGGNTVTKNENMRKTRGNVRRTRISNLFYTFCFVFIITGTPDIRIIFVRGIRGRGTGSLTTIRRKLKIFLTVASPQYKLSNAVCPFSKIISGDDIIASRF